MSKSILFMSFFSIITCYIIPTFVPKFNISIPTTNLGYDQCRFFQIYNSLLYRMGQSNIVSSWGLTSLNYLQQKMFQTPDWSKNISSISIGRIYNQILLTKVNSIVFDTLNPTTLIYKSLLNMTLSGYILVKIQSTATEYLALVSNSTANLLVISAKNLTITSYSILNFTGNMNSTLSQDQTTLLIWSMNSGLVKLFKLINGVWTYINTYTPSSNSSDMNSVLLSQNGTIAVFQYDSAAKLTVMNLTQFTIKSQIQFTNTIINKVNFLDKTCELIVLSINYSIIQIYNIGLSLQSTQNIGILSNYSQIEYESGLFYSCVVQNIQVFQILCPALFFRSPLTNLCVSCILDITCIGCDTNNGTCNQCIQNYSLSYNGTCEYSYINNVTNSSNQTNQTNFTSSNLNQSNLNSTIFFNNTVFFTNNYEIDTIFDFQEKTVSFLLSKFEILSPMLSAGFAGFRLVPLVLVFVSFINFWSLTCLYSIMKLNVPKYLITANEIIYFATHNSIFNLIGIQVNIPKLQFRQIPQEFQFNYQINVNFLSNCAENITLLLFNLVLLYLINNIIRKYLLSNDFFLCKYIKFNIMKIFICQFIGFLAISLVPYKYLINMVKFWNFQQKINMTLQILFFLLLILTPFIFIQTLTLHKNKQNKKNKANFKFYSVQEKACQLLFGIQKRSIRQILMFIKSISIGILIILPKYFPFFIVNFLLFYSDIKIASQVTKHRFFNVISSIFMLLYHSCYMIIYLFEDYQAVCHISGMVCLVILFAGGVFQILNVLIYSLISFINLIKDYLKRKQQIKQSKFIQKNKNQVFPKEASRLVSNGFFLNNKIFSQQQKAQSGLEKISYSIKQKAQIRTEKSKFQNSKIEFNNSIFVKKKQPQSTKKEVNILLNAQNLSIIYKSNFKETQNLQLEQIKYMPAIVKVQTKFMKLNYKNKKKVFFSDSS